MTERTFIQIGDTWFDAREIVAVHDDGSNVDLALSNGSQISATPTEGQLDGWADTPAEWVLAQIHKMRRSNPKAQIDWGLTQIRDQPPLSAYDHLVKERDEHYKRAIAAERDAASLRRGNESLAKRLRHAEMDTMPELRRERDEARRSCDELAHDLDRARALGETWREGIRALEEVDELRTELDAARRELAVLRGSRDDWRELARLHGHRINAVRDVLEANKRRMNAYWVDSRKIEQALDQAE